MNQTRTFLIFAWMMVAVLLWMAWGKEKTAAAAPAAASAQITTAASIPDMVPGAPALAAGVPAATVPGANASAATAAAAPAATNARRVIATTDVLRLTMDGGSIFDAELLHYPQTRDAGSPPVKLFDEDPAHYYVAQSGWVGQNGASAPSHVSGFMPETDAGQYTLQKGQQTVVVPFLWKNADGVVIRRTYTLTRSSYVIKVHDEVVNGGDKPWQGYVYRQLSRIPPAIKSGMTNPESYSFAGATWYSAEHDYERRKYKDFTSDGAIDRTVTGGWIALLQHHFFSAWIPQHDQGARFNLIEAGTVEGINAAGPAFTIKPGQTDSTDARLWVGPKLVGQMKAEAVPGLDRAVDYSRFEYLAILSEGLFWVLSKLHNLTGNWGWSIVVMVLLLKAMLFPLSAAQYKSAAKMRKFQPRIAQLKERYGDDKQKFQTAMMELYKKEKINPVGGCLPVLPQMIIFMALYWMLAESVELRQAPWTLWIQDLTARDPFFILPALNIAIMWTTQKLTPMAAGMDPTQQKMMQMMPLVFGVVLAFLPAGLVLYQVANGGIGLLQQWLITKKYADQPAKALIEKG